MGITADGYKKIFVGSGLLAEKEFSRALAMAGEQGKPVEAVLVEDGTLSNEQAGRLVADAYGVSFVNMKRLQVAPEAAMLIPDVLMRKHGMLAYAWKDGRLEVAMTDPSNIEIVGFLEKKTGVPIDIGYTTPGLLEEALETFSENLITKIVALSDSFEQLSKAGKIKEESEGQEGLVVSYTDLLLQYGYTNRASDVHIEPQEKASVVRYRIDGLLQDVAKMPKPLHDLVVARIKILSNLRTDEHFGAQDGKLRAVIEGQKVDVRVSIVPITGGEKIVMRILSDKGRAFSLDTLGFAPSDLARVHKAAECPYGMILATGPTGSGKTTSMYAVLKILNKRDVNIQTIEDPVEFDIEGVNQIQVNARTGLTFAAGLRSIVHQDPDVIMVGEIRDQETASIAVNSAMTGHLVLSTLHTNDAATTLPRLLDMGVEPFLVASSVNVIIAQRLVRRICGVCITSLEMSLAKLKTSIPAPLYKKYFGTKKSIRTYHGKGCTVCQHTGFHGRVGIFEVMEVTDSIRELITRRADAGVMKAKALTEGMTSMFEDGLRKLVDGVTTIEEVLRVAAD